LEKKNNLFGHSHPERPLIIYLLIFKCAQGKFDISSLVDMQ